MDNYPEHLAPEFEEGGAVLTPFDEWWPRVKGEFSNVPENVAQYWLHEHWSHSPYSYLASRDYFFELRCWNAENLNDIRSGWCDFDPRNRMCREKGREMFETHSTIYPLRTVAYMIEHGEFPVPIILLDNRDGHLSELDPLSIVPSGFVLIEGHRRFNIALYLHEIGRLRAFVQVWMMTFLRNQ